MPWLSNVFNVFTHKNVNIDDIKQRVQESPSDTADSISSSEMLAYISDIETRIKEMVKDLKNLYKKFNITFTGFKSYSIACDYLRDSVKDGSEEAYNNLIKLESMITGEQQRHLALIRMAVTADGKRVMDQINSNPEYKQMFTKIFGERDASGKIVSDGIYQRLWSEVHKLSEYILIKKNRVYH
jgi:hypothetical protein